MRMLLLVMLFLVGPLSTFAQISESGITQTGISLSLQPIQPSPQETYTISLNDYSGSFYGAEIIWYRNGTPITEAYNRKEITLTAPRAGAKDTIKALLKGSGGNSQELSAVIEPMYLDIIVEPQTHVPSFYTGRALPSVGSSVNLTALLGGSPANASAYVYTWKVNNVVLEGGPLRGRNEISFIMPQDSASVVSLQVTKLDGTIMARRAITIPAVAPKLLFYEVSTLYGIEPRALTGVFSLIGNSATLKAEPFFLSSTVFNSPDIITWTVAGKDIGTPGDNPYDVTLQKTGFPGITNIGFHVRSTDILLQGAKSGLSVSI
jgi:hypothetical protein